MKSSTAVQGRKCCNDWSPRFFEQFAVGTLLLGVVVLVLWAVSGC